MGIPKAIASDDGPEFKGEFKIFYKVKALNTLFVTTHLSFIDRFTRTIKTMLFEREQHTGKSWHLFLQNVINHIIIQYIHQHNLNLLMLCKMVMHHMLKQILY